MIKWIRKNWVIYRQIFAFRELIIILGLPVAPWFFYMFLWISPSIFGLLAILFGLGFCYVLWFLLPKRLTDNGVATKQSYLFLPAIYLILDCALGLILPYILMRHPDSKIFAMDAIKIIFWWLIKVGFGLEALKWFGKKSTEMT